MQLFGQKKDNNDEVGDKSLENVFRVHIIDHQSLVLKSLARFIYFSGFSVPLT